MSKNTRTITFVGLDVHAETTSIAVAEEGRAAARSVATIPNEAGLIGKAMKKLGSAKSLRVCY